MRSMHKSMSKRSYIYLFRLLRESRSGSMCRMRSLCKNMSRRSYRTDRKGECKMKKKHWYDYLWIWSIIYFALGFFNILFAWLGMIDFLIPLGFAVFKGNKNFCNRYCGRGQLLQQLGGTYKCSRNRKTPSWMSSKWFRYGFLIFFLAMFANMLFQT